MNTKKIFYVGVVIIAVIVAIVIFVFWNKSQREKLILANPPIEQPLLLGGGVNNATQERQQKIDEFKRKILARASLKIPLTAEERINFEIILVKGTNSSGDYMLADQSVLKFTEEELRLISDALKYK